MSAVSWVSIIALAGWLVLMLAAFRAHRIEGKTVWVMALAWGAIFLLITAIISFTGAAEPRGH